MKALVWNDRKKIEVIQTPVKTTPKGYVKIAVKYCGICGTDLHEYEAGPIFIPTENPHSLTNEKAPVILGHEFAGTIVPSTSLLNIFLKTYTLPVLTSCKLGSNML